MKGRERERRSSLQGMFWRVIAIVLVTTQIVACGSVLDALPGAGKSGSKSSDLAPVQSMGTLSGVAKDGLIRNAAVNIYAWNGTKGELLGSGVTDSRGRYSLQLQTRSQSVLLEVSGGDYLEEATLKSISLDNGQALYALRNYTSGQPLTTSITYYTTLATGLAEHLVRLGMKPPDAVEEANSRVGRIIGVDAGTVKPTDILDPDSVSVPELEYGFATAALSSLTERASVLNDSEPHAIFTSVRFIQAAYDDVRADGVLNGRGSNGDVVLGRIRLSSQIYRHELALHILRIANNKTANRTGRGPMEMFELAKRLNDSTDPIFGGDPVIPIDRDKPNVSALVSEEFPNLNNATVVFGGLNLSAMVTAFPGAARADLLLDDRVVGTATDPENPSVRLETNPSIAEGRHTLKLRVTDIAGAIGESPVLEVNVSNQQTAIENVDIAGKFVGMQTFVTAVIVDPALPRRIQYSVRPQGTATFVPVATIMANGDEVMLQPSVSIDPRQSNFNDGDATLKIEVTNSVGSIFAREVAFIVDKEGPSVVALEAVRNTAPPPGRYYDEDLGEPCVPGQPTDTAGPCVFYARMPFDVGSQVTDNSAVERVTFTVDGDDVRPPLVLTGIEPSVSSTFTVDPRRFGAPIGGGVETIATVVATDKAGNMSMASQKLVLDTTAPTASDFQITAVVGNEGSIVVDGDPMVVKGPVNISARVQDDFGVASAQLLLNGAGIGATVLDQGVVATIPSLQLDTSQSAPNGVNTVSVVAVDRAGNQMFSANRVSFEVDNAAPVLTPTGLSFDEGRCQLQGSVSDARFDSLVFTTDRGFVATIPPDETGVFVIRLGRDSGDFRLEASDTLGNLTTRNFSVIKTLSISGGVLGSGIFIPGTCELRENGARLFRIDEVED